MATSMAIFRFKIANVGFRAGRHLILHEMEAELTRVLEETKHVRRFVFRALGMDVLHFIPGQFVIVTIPDLPEFQNTRSYSINVR